MPEFTFDMNLTATITVDCPTREEGEAELRRILDCANTNFGAFKSGEPVLGEVTLDLDSLRLGMVDGLEFVPSDDEKWINCALDHGAEFTEPAKGQKYWAVYDRTEETWRVDASGRCKTKATAARAYCESEGCEP